MENKLATYMDITHTLWNLSIHHQEGVVPLKLWQIKIRSAYQADKYFN